MEDIFEKKRILVVDDDPHMIEVLTVNLERAGYQVDSAETGGGGLGLALSGDYDLLVLDLQLPDLDGLQVCKTLRQNGSRVPIMMLTSRKADPQKVAGFESGSDDYLTKPFSMAELLARVKALIRRVEMHASPGVVQKRLIEIGALCINPEKRAVTVNGRGLELTATEFDLLAFLASHPGRAFTREELLEQVWDYSCGGYESTVNVHINRLRNKIEPEPGAPCYVLTVWGVGYRFAEAAEVDGHGQRRAAGGK